MKQSLQQFTEQLATWTIEAIDRGRTPFRKVETCATIATALGPTEIALIFWINRQSMMAGGLVLLPEDDIERELERGYHAAQALGLKHFVTWEQEQVRIWDCSSAEVTEQQRFVLKDPDYLETFRFTLDDLLDALKLTAVLGAIPTAELGTAYFHNLARITLQQALPSMIDSYRTLRSAEGAMANIDIDQYARERNNQLLLQIIALLWLGKLPTNILPEQLEATLEQAVSALPLPFASTLALKALDNPVPLPLDAAVAYHHFLLRLRQLSWNSSDERVEATLQQLNLDWFPQQPESNGEICAWLYPEAPPTQQSSLVISHSPTLLAMTALLHRSAGLTLPRLHFRSLLTLTTDQIPETEIKAYLCSPVQLSATQRSEFVAHLRNAWPHRRFKLRSGQPCWYWELIHLLGISRHDRSLHIIVPRSALQSSIDSSLWILLYDHFRLITIIAGDDHLQICLQRKPQHNSILSVQAKDSTREVIPATSLAEFRSRILLALNLSNELYKLVIRNFSWLQPSQLKATEQHGLEIYKNSRFYQLLSNITDANDIDTGESSSANTDREAHLPYPDKTALRQLCREQQGDKVQVDELLAQVFFCPELSQLTLPQRNNRRRQPQTQGPDRKELKAQLLREAEIFGLPNFPDQYLYFLDQPEMQTFSIAPPLSEHSRLLDEFTLIDDGGKKLTGFGQELEDALMFCSRAGHRTFELPRERSQLNTMLEHYRKDINALYEHISNICYSHYEEGKEARKLLNNVWKKLPLPAPTDFS